MVIILLALMDVRPFIIRPILPELFLPTRMNTVHFWNSLLDLLVEELANFIFGLFLQFWFAIF